MTQEPLGICILAGGQATRLPGKLEAPVAGVPMLVRVYRNVAPAGEVWLSTKGPLPADVAAEIPARAVIDRWPLRGPLSGLISTLSEMPHTWVFAVAGDAPLVDAAFVRSLAGYIAPDCEAIVPRHTGEGARVEPLASLYRRAAFLREALPLLMQGEGKPRLVIERLKTRFVPVGDDRAFANVNTPSDLAALRESLA
ncbi:MAG: molybdenum cofactor guanylyltransferase [Candidatus Eremiobacteraeota bacterium]|nr:molybdenum cofactor guanylyltransferase [Candidatus Eremiobacteraeota bacterium]